MYHDLTDHHRLVFHIDKGPSNDAHEFVFVNKEYLSDLVPAISIYLGRYGTAIIGQIPSLDAYLFGIVLDDGVSVYGLAVSKNISERGYFIGRNDQRGSPNKICFKFQSHDSSTKKRCFLDPDFEILGSGGLSSSELLDSIQETQTNLESFTPKQISGTTDYKFWFDRIHLNYY